MFSVQILKSLESLPICLLWIMQLFLNQVGVIEEHCSLVGTTLMGAAKTLFSRRGAY